MNRRAFLGLLAGLPLIGPTLLDGTPVTTLPGQLLYGPVFTGWYQPANRMCHEAYWHCMISTPKGETLQGSCLVQLTDMARRHQRSLSEERALIRAHVENGWQSLLEVLPSQGIDVSGLRMPAVAYTRGFSGYDQLR